MLGVEAGCHQDQQCAMWRLQDRESPARIGANRPASACAAGLIAVERERPILRKSQTATTRLLAPPMVAITTSPPGRLAAAAPSKLRAQHPTSVVVVTTSYHSLGNLPEPESTQDFCEMPKSSESTARVELPPMPRHIASPKRSASNYTSARPEDRGYSVAG
jgi:hypothetical protein